MASCNRKNCPNIKYRGQQLEVQREALLRASDELRKINKVDLAARLDDIRWEMHA